MTETNKASTVLSYLVGQGLKIEESKRVTRSLEDVYLEIVRQEESNE